MARFPPPFDKAPPEIQEKVYNHPAFAPFIHAEPPIGLYERTKMVIMLPIAILRIVFGVLFFALHAFFARLIFLGYNVDKPGPQPKWRRFLAWLNIRIGARVLFFVLGFYNIKVTGETRPKDNFTFVGNHASIIDILAVAMYSAPSFLSKKTVTSVPLLGFPLRAWRGMTLDRVAQRNRHANHNGNNGQASELVQQIIRRQHEDDGNPRLCLFPEGTTTNHRYLIRFHKGAFISGLPVRPVLIRYRFKHCNPSWETIGPLQLIYRIATQFSHHMELEFLPPYYPSDAEKADVQLYADNVSKFMAERLNFPVTHHTLAHKIVMHRVLLGKITWEEAEKQLAPIWPAKH